MGWSQYQDANPVPTSPISRLNIPLRHRWPYYLSFLLPCMYICMHAHIVCVCFICLFIRPSIHSSIFSSVCIYVFLFAILLVCIIRYLSVVVLSFRNCSFLDNLFLNFCCFCFFFVLFIYLFILIYNCGCLCVVRGVYRPGTV